MKTMYGQVAIYRGGIGQNEYYIDLDYHHRFFLNKAELVCGNTAAILTETRYSQYFDVIGDRENHFVVFVSCCSPLSNNLDSRSNEQPCC